MIPLLLLLSAFTEPSAPVPQWYGYRVDEGTRRVPVIGELKTRMETWSVASIEPDGAGLLLRETPCRVRFESVAGVRVSMDARYLPTTAVRFSLERDGVHRASSVREWGAEDVDRDGRPGMTVTVDATICSGELWVANRASTEASGRHSGDRFQGRTRSRVHQTVLGRRGACLRATEERTDEVLTGRFAFRAARGRATCADLESQGWPPLGP